MKFISIQPANNYFVWQLEVLDRSLEKNGYDKENFFVMFLHDGNISDNVVRYAAKNKSRVIFERDDRLHKFYIPSIKLYGLHKFYQNHAHRLAGDNLFLHDSDIIFTKYFDWNSIVTDPNTVYCSDTVSYIGAQYIDSKSPELTNAMCDMVGISSKYVREQQANSGGAQYIFPAEGIHHFLFKKAEIDSNNLYKFMSENGAKYKKEGDYEIQKWTAEMWSNLWNLWLYGFQTQVHPAMEFGWSGWSVKEYDRINIVHYAGVTNNTDGKFYKALYINKMPFGQDLSYVKNDNLTYKVVEIIQELDGLKTYYSY